MKKIIQIIVISCCLLIVVALVLGAWFDPLSLEAALASLWLAIRIGLLFLLLLLAVLALVKYLNKP